MTFSRNRFFLMLSTVFVLIFFAPKILWLANAKATTGEVWFTGHGNLGSVLGTSTYQVVRFAAGKDTIEFNGTVNLGLDPGTQVPVLYQRSNPSDAKINVFLAIWGQTLIYCLFPLSVLLVLFVHPSAIPRKSKIRIGGKGIISII